MSTLDRRYQDEAFCPQYHHAVELIGRRWAGAILRAMLFGATRFSQIADAIPALSDKMLAQRLRDLEAEGLVVRDVIPDTPVRIEYTLTEKGRALDTAIEALSAWADEWVPDPDAPTEP